jgi:DNA-binding NtrC family response regulator
MNPMTTKPPLLALDGDENILSAISRVAAPHYHVLVTRDPRRLLGWMENYPNVAVVVTEHVLQTSHGVALLATARSIRPDAIRVLLTTFGDLSSIVDGLHTGAIQRMVQKPFTPAELLQAIMPEGLVAEQAKRASA